ncbi:hypothetical protein T4A_9752 [Trichinella pseudospiralis]|uniref:Uncharacterized protein n=1 Tax=Trichinella pseudospiralis TaxID=6337 RepID=A0A0V1FU10_TRIPS|nr:hypothetical protein T4E_9959 [Trichinella pseudospiralis]KRY68159.1 hypothetical protein T4A_9752 [Trichinella pseudospiralis]KRY89327.1 hypothetical protein T4D_15401 [Trichinella pseudospiralis]
MLQMAKIATGNQQGYNEKEKRQLALLLGTTYAEQSFHSNNGQAVQVTDDGSRGDITQLHQRGITDSCLELFSTTDDNRSTNASRLNKRRLMVKFEQQAEEENLCKSSSITIHHL